MLLDIKCQNIWIPSLVNILEDSQTLWSFRKVLSNNTFLEQQQMWHQRIGFHIWIPTLGNILEDSYYFWKMTLQLYISGTRRTEESSSGKKMSPQIGGLDGHVGFRIALKNNFCWLPVPQYSWNKVFSTGEWLRIPCRKSGD